MQGQVMLEGEEGKTCSTYLGCDWNIENISLVKKCLTVLSAFKFSVIMSQGRWCYGAMVNRSLPTSLQLAKLKT